MAAPIDRLRLFRQRSLTFSVVLLLGLAIALGIIPTQEFLRRVLIAIAAVTLISLWIADFRRDRAPSLVIPVEAFLIFGLAAAARSVMAGLGAAYAAIQFRALYGSRRRVALIATTNAAAFVAVILAVRGVEGLLRPVVPVQVLALVSAGFLFHWVKEYSDLEHAHLQAQLSADIALAQVQAIKMQVHPHFLYNTLHAIGVLIPEDPGAATRMVTLLGQFLRRSLQHATQAEVALREEIELLKLYLDIEHIRFEDRLAAAFELAPESLDAMVPDLILQPLVENALKHGIGPSSEGGRVTMRSRIVGEQLVLEIENSGASMENDAVRLGIGLATVKDRLERLYGSRATFELRSSNSVTTARVTLPVRWHKPDAVKP